MTLLDWGIVALYAAGMVVLGWWVGLKQHTSEDYYVAGRRLGWFLIGVSTMATQLSAIRNVGNDQAFFFTVRTTHAVSPTIQRDSNLTHRVGPVLETALRSPWDLWAPDPSIYFEDQ